MSLNPNVKKLEIGVRELKTITIYPMSMADELKFTKTIFEAFQRFQLIAKPLPEFNEETGEPISLDSEENYSDQAFFIVKAIQENLLEILAMICEESVGLEDLTNDNFAEICNLIYDMNFSSALGKLHSLWTKIKGNLPQTRNIYQPTKPLPNSSSQQVTE